MSEGDGAVEDLHGRHLGEMILDDRLQTRPKVGKMVCVREIV